MLLTIELQNRLMPVLAPVGAAAYAVQESETAASVIFAMMHVGETGITTLMRVRRKSSMLKWRPVAARPELQRQVSTSTKDFLAYDFELQDGEWVPRTSELKLYLEMISRVSAIPAQAPDDMYTTLEEWLARERGEGDKVPAV
jgi:hypothetical protein